MPLCGITEISSDAESVEIVHITKRADRVNAGKSTDSTKMLLAMEDFCQLSGRLTSDKYKSSYEQCGKVISRYSKNVGLDMAELYYRLLFCFVTGNSDMHLKNFSLIEDKPGSRKFGLSPAYDLLPVNVILPDDYKKALTELIEKRCEILC
ncbi:HipA domain-containing protein [Butyrivibrio sp. INlla16]|uniref:HipA domain-containing protein n=1 Tax=Butyrivibrio sp. INlla16 TaxID=1520807 RepID=UPI00088FF5EF|nr:HipA domain-containing protein [Butyrivibrio sp. INlla16]SDB18854.1 HipA-like C-terminal domain-containing protein [Butyrivibrio sp. INlla16]